MKMSSEESATAQREINSPHGKMKSAVYVNGQKVGDTYCGEFTKEAADELIESCERDFARHRWMAEYNVSRWHTFASFDTIVSRMSLV